MQGEVCCFMQSNDSHPCLHFRITGGGGDKGFKKPSQGPDLRDVKFIGLIRT